MIKKIYGETRYCKTQHKVVSSYWTFYDEKHFSWVSSQRAFQTLSPGYLWVVEVSGKGGHFCPCNQINVLIFCGIYIFFLNAFTCKITKWNDYVCSILKKMSIISRCEKTGTCSYVYNGRPDLCLKIECVFHGMSAFMSPWYEFLMTRSLTHHEILTKVCLLVYLFIYLFMV